MDETLPSHREGTSISKPEPENDEASAAAAQASEANSAQRRGQDAKAPTIRHPPRRARASLRRSRLRGRTERSTSSSPAGANRMQTTDATLVPITASGARSVFHGRAKGAARRAHRAATRPKKNQSRNKRDNEQRLTTGRCRHTPGCFKQKRDKN